jgi:hypothetical protein
MFVKRSRKIIEKFAGANIIRIFSGANFFGQETLGVWQFRGNGVLILTTKELYFELWIPKSRECRIPLESIQKIETTKWHLKKSKNRTLLKIIFTNKKGETDSAAWLVRDLQQWIDAIQRQIDNR